MAQELILISKERYERLMKQPQPTEPTDPGRDERVTNDHDEKPDNNFMSVIGYSFPHNLKKHATELYRFVLAQDKDVVNHNQQGELELNGETITGSNILDIIKYTVSTRQRKTPVGSKQFQDLLHKLDVPKRLIAERKKSSLTQSGGLFVKGNGRRDILPGTSNKKENIRWLKY